MITILEHISFFATCLFSYQKVHIIVVFFRSTHEVVEIEGMVYALGGNDGSASLNSMERYDSKMNKWFMVTAMNSRRSSVGAAVLECFGLEKVINSGKLLA